MWMSTSNLYFTKVQDEKIQRNVGLDTVFPSPRVSDKEGGRVTKRVMRGIDKGPSVGDIMQTEAQAASRGTSPHSPCIQATSSPEKINGR